MAYTPDLAFVNAKSGSDYADVTMVAEIA